MNDFDEFAEIALAIFFILTLLIWVLTDLERTLIDPASHRDQRGAEPPGSKRSADMPPTDQD